MRNVRRKQVDQSRKTRNLIILTCGILLFIYLTFIIIFGENGLLRYIELKSMRDDLSRETSVIESQNRDIEEHLETMKKEPDFIEERAREHGLTKEGELVFKFKDDE